MWYGRNPMKHKSYGNIIDPFYEEEQEFELVKENIWRMSVDEIKTLVN